MENFENNELNEVEGEKAAECESFGENNTPAINETPDFQPEIQPEQPEIQPEPQPVSFSENPAEMPYAEEIEPQPVPPVPPLEPIEYSPVKPINDYKPASKGLKIFALVIAAVILITGSCATGYLIGRKTIFNGGNKNFSDVELAARPENTDEMTPAEVYKKIDPSVVGIAVYNQNGDGTYATGVVYTSDGYIVTNDHIYSEISAPKFKIYMYDGKEYSAEYVAGDVVSDLAVLKIDASGLTEATFGDSSEIFCGENVVAVGKPSAATDKSTITKGIVSLTSTRVQTTSSYSARLIQTDSAINPGSSGGALSNMYGQVIGITSSKLAGTLYDAVGYAIPSVTVKRVADQLIKDKKVTSRAKLGISYTLITSILSEIKGVDTVGLSIAEVSEESDLYGKADVGDIITHIDGVEITRDELVLDIIENAAVGDTVTLTIKNTSGNVNDYTVRLIANTGESSFNPILEKKSESGEDNNNSSESGNGGNNEFGGGTFDFPFGY